MPTVVQDVSGDSALQTAIAALKAKIEGAEESEEIASLKEDLNENVGELKSALEETTNNGTTPIEKTVTWQNGFVQTGGRVTASTRSGYAIVPCNAGETVVIGTKNKNIAIIGSTTADSLSIGDNVTVIQKTGAEDVFETFRYTATKNIKLVLCVLLSDYTLDFYAPSQVIINIGADIEKKQYKTCSNLIGNELNGLYPVKGITTGSYLTFSTSDGSPIGLNPGQTNIAFYNSNKEFIDYYAFISSFAVRTIGPLSAVFADVAYMGIKNCLPRVPIMVNEGQTALPYEEYYLSATEITKKVSDLDMCCKSLESAGNKKLAVVTAISKHVSGNGNPTKNALTMLWCTDIHAEAERTNRMVALLNAWGTDMFDIAINTGDTTDTLYTDGLSWYDNIIATSNIPILNTVGNHDAWLDLNGSLAPKTDVYNMVIAPVARQTSIVQPSNAASQGLCYYYKDVNGIRIIVLDCMYWDADELSWFENVLDDAKTNGLTVITCIHYPFSSTYRTMVESRWNTGVPNISASVVPISAAEAVSSFISAGGRFVCWLQGHSHADRIVQLNGYDNQLCLQATSFTNRETLVYKATDTLYYNYDALTVITVDTTDKLIKIYRIGANINGVGQKYNGFSYNYENHQVLSDW